MWTRTTADSPLRKAGSRRVRSLPRGDGLRSVDDRHGAPRAFGFALEGAHAAAPCVDCHRELARPRRASTLILAATTAPRIPFGQKRTACADCHQDMHGGQFKMQDGVGACNGCHGLESFKPAARFDHDRGTAFALRGAHASVACAKCHTRRKDPDGVERVQYRPVPRDCESCHGGKQMKGVGVEMRAGARPARVEPRGRTVRRPASILTLLLVVAAGGLGRTGPGAGAPDPDYPHGTFGRGLHDLPLPRGLETGEVQQGLRPRQVRHPPGRRARPDHVSELPSHPRIRGHRHALRGLSSGHSSERDGAGMRGLPHHAQLRRPLACRDAPPAHPAPADRCPQHAGLRELPRRIRRGAPQLRRHGLGVRRLSHQQLSSHPAAAARAEHVLHRVHPLPRHVELGRGRAVRGGVALLRPREGGFR